MKLEKNYLSDEALNALIADIEEHDLVSAPPELLNHVLDKIEASEPYIKAFSSFEVQKKKKVEFRTYCIQVITSVAAAILLIFLLPTSIPKVEVPAIPSKNMILEDQIIKTKEDVTNQEKLKWKDFFKDMEWLHMFE